MRLAAAILCDFAEVREGLLIVVAGGVTRLWRPQLPAPMAVFLALLIEVPPEQRPFPHELRVDVHGPTGAALGNVRGGFQIGPAVPFDPEEIGYAPVALDLRLAQVAQYGWHTIQVSIDGEPASPIRFKVAPPPQQPQGAVPMPAGRKGKPH